MPIADIIKLLFLLLSNPEIEHEGASIIEELRGHDPQGEKITNIIRSTTALLSATNAVRNGANN